MTLRARDDGFVRGDHNISVKFGAYVYTGDERYPTSGYLPIGKYYTANGQNDDVVYSNRKSFNVTLSEVDRAGLDIVGCDLSLIHI